MTDHNSQFFAILTAIGKAKQANADALGIPWTFSQMGVGDANGTDPIPDEQQTQLINEHRRAPLNQLKVDPANPNIIIAEQVIPENVGGWWIREVGLYDADDDLVAVANCAPSFKPLLSQGSGRTQVVRMNLIVSNTANVTLRIDPSVVLATRGYVDSLTVRASQAEAETGEENSKIMTPRRVFQAIAKVITQATETAFGWAKIATQEQVTAGTDDATLLTPKKLRGAQASQLEAETGTVDSKLMTPLRVFQAIAKVVTQATETAFGWAKIATQEQVTTGTDDAAIVTPKKLRAGQASQVEAEAGTDNTKLMTPLRAIQTIRSAAAAASETLRGGLRIGTQNEVNAGTLDNVAVTPAKMCAGIAYSLSANGYIVLPWWLFRISLMWGTAQTNASGVGSTTFPVAFPTACWHVLGTGRATNPSLIGILGGGGAPTRTGYTWYASTITGSGGVLGIDWIAIGH
jgi:phage-related tail fiber protein